MDRWVSVHLVCCCAYWISCASKVRCALSGISGENRCQDGHCKAQQPGVYPERNPRDYRLFFTYDTLHNQIAVMRAAMMSVPLYFYSTIRDE